MNTALNLYSSEKDISIELLNDIYSEYVFSQTINQEILSKMIAEQGFEGGYLEKRTKKNDFIIDIDCFIKETYVKYDYAPTPKKEKKIPTKEQMKIIEEKKNELKKMELISQINFDKFKENNPIKENYTKENIEDILKNEKYKTYNTFLFDTKENMSNHIFYHGTKSIDSLENLKPSIVLDAGVELGGGYGEKYYGISLSKDKSISAEFSGLADGNKEGAIYTLLLSPKAKLLELPIIEDSIEIEENIEEYWKYGVDAIYIGGGEKELIVLNPGCIKIINESILKRENYLNNNIRNISEKELNTLFNKYENSLNNTMREAKENAISNNSNKKENSHNYER